MGWCESNRTLTGWCFPRLDFLVDDWCLFLPILKYCFCTVLDVACCVMITSLLLRTAQFILNTNNS